MAEPTIRFDIDFSVNDSPDSLVAFLRHVEPIFDPATMGWQIDFSNCPYVGPDAVAVVAAMVLEARRTGVAHDVVVPTGGPALEAFFEFSGLSELLAGASVSPTDDPDRVFIPIRVQHQANFGDPDPVIRLIKRFVPLADDAEEYLRICINEVVQNVEDHARSEIGCVTCARFLKDVCEVHVAIVDRGRGIGSSLAERYPDVDGAAEALRRVLQGGYSAKSRPNNMGVGISNLTNIVVQQLQGELFIVTEDAVADGKFGRGTSARVIDVRYPGTAVFFSVPVA